MKMSRGNSNRPMPNDVSTKKLRGWELHDKKDKRNLFQVGDLVNIIYKNTDHAGKLAKVTKVEKNYVWTENLDNGIEAKWGYVVSLEKIWVVS